MLEALKNSLINFSIMQLSLILLAITMFGLPALLIYWTLKKKFSKLYFLLLFIEVLLVVFFIIIFTHTFG